MSEPTVDEVPPLGERTPDRPSRPRLATVRGHGAVVGTVGLVVGMLAGFGLARLTDGTAAGGDAATAPPEASLDDPSPATTAVTVPEQCVETIRSAQRAVAAFDRGVQAMRDLDVAALQEAGEDMQRLQSALDGPLERCLERVAR
jgi:hypothetical protein